MIRYVLLLVFIPLSVWAQEPIVINVDSFPAFVKTVTMTGYFFSVAENGDTILTKNSSRYLEVGEDGRWTTRTEIFPDGDISNDTMRYDAATRTRTVRRDNSFEPSTTTTVYNPNGTIRSIFIDADQCDDIMQEFEYDKNGKLLRKTETFSDSRIVTQHTYDKSGRLVQSTTSSGSVTDKKLNKDFRAMHAYNQIGLRERTIEEYLGMNESVRISDTIWFEYDEMKRLIRQTESRQNGMTRMIYEYEYDNKSRLIEKNYRYDDKEKGESGFVFYSWEYDSAGYYSLSSEKGDSYGMTVTWRTTYNDKGLPVKCYYSTEAEVWLYKWEYEYW